MKLPLSVAALASDFPPTAPLAVGSELGGRRGELRGDAVVGLMGGGEGIAGRGDLKGENQEDRACGTTLKALTFDPDPEGRGAIAIADGSSQGDQGRGREVSSEHPLPYMRSLSKRFTPPIHSSYTVQAYAADNAITLRVASSLEAVRRKLAAPGVASS